jgi:hypothetical protein
MSLLKVSTLTISGLTLWLAPPFIFSRKIPLHNFMQGIALVSGFACCFEARKGALRLAKEAEFEAMKDAVVTADVVLLIASDSNRELLERALALSSEDEEAENVQRVQNADKEFRERIHQLQARGYGKAKIIFEIWGATKGGSDKYKAAEAEYKRLIQEEGG